jgi:hypothetical protein
MQTYGAVLVIFSLAAGCGSEVPRAGAEASASSASGATGGGGAAGSGGGGTGASGGDDGCDCHSAEVCHDGACYAGIRVLASMLQVGTTTLPGIGVGVADMAWRGGPFRSVGDCFVGPFPTDPPLYYKPTSLDIGSATFQVDAGQVFTFPPLENGGAFLTVFPPTLPAEGGNTLSYAWTGGADVPSGAVVFTMPGGPGNVTFDAFVPGQPWTIVWEQVSGRASMQLTTPDGDYVTCFAEDTDMTIAAELTSLIDTSDFDGPYDVAVIFSTNASTQEIVPGVVGTGLATHSVTLDVL